MDDILRAHEFAIYRTSYSNGGYDTYTSTEVYRTPGFINPRRTNGPTGCTGATGSRGVAGPNQIQYQMTPKRFDAYRIVSRPRDDTKESYESLVVPFLDQYADLGVRVSVTNPSEDRIRLGINPNFQAQFEELNRLNAEVPVFNECIRYLYDSIRNHTTLNIDDYINTTNLSPANRTLLRERYDRIVVDIENDNDQPYMRRYEQYQRTAPYDWYNYETVINYNNEPKLELYAHQGTQLYGIIRSLIPGDGSWTKPAR